VADTCYYDNLIFETHGNYPFFAMYHRSWRRDYSRTACRSLSIL
jgi:hypothetical protein